MWLTYCLLLGVFLLLIGWFLCHVTVMWSCMSGVVPRRFNDFYSRYTSLVDPYRSSSSVTTATTSSTMTSSTSPATSTSSTATTAHQSAYIPLSRRRQLEQEENERKEQEQLSKSGTTTSPTSQTGSTTTAVYRRWVAIATLLFYPWKQLSNIQPNLVTNSLPNFC